MPRQLFVSPAAIQGVGQQVAQTAMNAAAASPQLGPAMNAAATAYNMLPPDAQQQLKGKVQQVGTRVRDSVRRGPRSQSSPRRVGNDGYSQGGKPFGNMPGFSLSSAPNPRREELNTPIKPDTFVFDYMTATNGSCSPLHMTNIIFAFPTYAATKLSDYFQKIIAFDIQTKSQANVSFSLDVTGTNGLTATNIQTAMNNLTYALQVYFYYSSILSYTADPANKNDGMQYLRGNITATTLEKYRTLQRRLCDTPCPPRLLSFMRYIMGNYYSGDTQGSPIIKFCPISGSDTCLSDTLLDTCLSNFNTSANLSVFTLMRRAVPQWTPKVIEDVAINPAYDAQFKTIFANAPANYYDGTNQNKPMQVVATGQTAMPYNTFTEKLDGAAFALTSVYSTADSNWLPGLMTPINTGSFLGVSRLSYYQIGGISKFYSVNESTFLIRSRQETYTVTDAGTAILTPHLFGSDKCQNVTGDAIRQSAMRLLDYLMSLDMLRIDARSYLQDEAKSNSNSSGYKQQRKGRRR